MAIPVSGRAEGFRACGNNLHGIAVIALMKMAEIVAVELVNFLGLACCKKQMRVWRRHIRQKKGTAGAKVTVSLVEVLLIGWSEVVADRETLGRERQL